jgi:DNA-binding MurR/RpiR family transcriptional regulator
LTHYTRTCTPYEIADSRTAPDLACIVSPQGEHRDILACFEVLQERGIPTIILTSNSRSSLLTRVERIGRDVGVVLGTIPTNEVQLE